jgi:voltage-gated potassium channel
MPDRRDVAAFLRRLRTLAVVLVAILALGTAGFMATEGVGAWRGFIWTLDILATVGSIPPPETVAGQALKVGLIVLRVGTLFYGLVTVTEVFVSGHLAELLSERRAQSSSTPPTTTTSSAASVAWAGRSPATCAPPAPATSSSTTTPRCASTRPGSACASWRASRPTTRSCGGGDHARHGVIACVDSDADNIFITLTVRGLRPDIAVVARAWEESVEAKLLRAGATRVISPYKTSGSEMARLALNPQIRGALEVAPAYRMEEIEVAAGSAGEGQPIGDVRGGAIIVGVRDPSGQFQPQPPAETVLRAGDVVTALGTERTMERLEELFAAAPTRTRS